MVVSTVEYLIPTYILGEAVGMPRWDGGRRDANTRTPVNDNYWIECQLEKKLYFSASLLQEYTDLTTMNERLMQAANELMALNVYGKAAYY